MANSMYHVLFGDETRLVALLVSRLVLLLQQEALRVHLNRVVPVEKDAPQPGLKETNRASKTEPEPVSLDYPLKLEKTVTNSSCSRIFERWGKVIPYSLPELKIVEVRLQPGS